MKEKPVVCIAETCIYNHAWGTECDHNLKHFMGMGKCPKYTCRVADGDRGAFSGSHGGRY